MDYCDGLWRRLEDDLRTLIASGFEFPAIDLPLSTDSVTAREDVRYLPDIQGHKGLVQPDRSAPTAIEMLGTSGDAVNGVEASPVASCAETEFKAVERDDGEDKLPAYNGGCADTPAVIRDPNSTRSAQSSVPISGNTPQKRDLRMSDRVDELTPPRETRQKVEGPPLVSRVLMGRYDRAKLYELVWSMSGHQAGKAIGVDKRTIQHVCKSLHIPSPPAGYWSKKLANRPVGPRPLLLPVRVAETGLLANVNYQPTEEK